MSAFQTLMESDLFKACLDEMDAAGAVSSKTSFDVNGVPMLGLVITVGAISSPKVMDIMAKLEKENFIDPKDIIIPARGNYRGN